MITLMAFCISIFVTFGIAYYFFITEGKRVVKHYFESKFKYENNRQSLYVLLNAYFKKHKISFLDIDISTCKLQGRKNNEIFVIYSCIEGNKIVKKPIHILIKDL